MDGNTSQHRELGELEFSILLCIWRRGAMTAEQVREELWPPVVGHAVRAALRRLEEAGRLAHSTEGDAVLYRPREPQNEAASAARIGL